MILVQTKNHSFEWFVLYKTSFLQCGVSAFLLNCLDSLGRNSKGDAFVEFRNIDLLFLEVCISASHAGRVELSCTSTVGVTSAVDAALICDCASFCHCVRHVTI